MNKDVMHIYSGMLLIQKNEIMPFSVTWMDLEIIILSEVSQIEKDKYHMTSLICEILKTVQMNYLFTNINRVTAIENKGCGGGVDKLGEKRVPPGFSLNNGKDGAAIH